ncbi:hypothetical protein FOVG_19687 [Fusarium oxysporum f. sp. pisi HDV247]|uniref:Uncharacterized protein n=1 Tax=Fusarium oxysporum f. sp. pisi HDV247 TaxID=1080344 RepID=W9NDD3_FUSOX|nr:hypothetical protein FOVG_19687 [Fusarium oxysporum f. sp. pisi HDV247]
MVRLLRREYAKLPTPFLPASLSASRIYKVIQYHAHNAGIGRYFWKLFTYCADFSGTSMRLNIHGSELFQQPR